MEGLTFNLGGPMKLLITLSLILFSFQSRGLRDWDCDKEKFVCSVPEQKINIYRDQIRICDNALSIAYAKRTNNSMLKKIELNKNKCLVLNYRSSTAQKDIRLYERQNRPDLANLLREGLKKLRIGSISDKQKTAEDRRKAEDRRQAARKALDAQRAKQKAAQREKERDPFSGQYDPFHLERERKKRYGDRLRDKDKCPALKWEMKTYQRYEANGFNKPSTRSSMTYYFTRADITTQKKKQYKPILLANIRIHCGAAVADGFAAISNAVAGNTPTNSQNPQRAVSRASSQPAVNELAAIKAEIQALKDKFETCGCQARQAGNR